MKIFLIAHTTRNGHNVACKEVPAQNETKARQYFEDLYPQRRITKVGIKGEEG